MPWKRWLRIGLGILGWTPETFWKATPIELYRALEGWQEAHGIEPGEEEEEPMGMDRLKEMMDEYPD